QEGRPFATCSLIKGGEPGDNEVIFQITEGPKVRVGDIRFVGNSDFVSSARLKTLINSSDGPLGWGVFGSQYNSAMIDADVNELLKYYRSFGYHDVKIGRELRYSPDGEHVTIIFHIQEGVRYRMTDKPSVHGVKCVPCEALEAMSQIKAGDYYDQRKI